MQHRFVACALLLGGLCAAACGNTVTTAPTPTTPTTAVTETFTGTLTKNGAVTYAFATGAGGVSATVTSLAPDATIVVGINLGIWNGVSCQIVLTNDKAGQGTVVNGSATAAGNLCVRIYDVGLVVQPETYQIDVAHF